MLTGVTGVISHGAELVLTADRSHTLYLPALNEHYHSVHGAISESRHIYINAGLLAVPAKDSALRVLEIGFGTGLNALLSLIYAETYRQHISYTTIEPFPLELEMVSRLNYLSELGSPEYRESFIKMHSDSQDFQQLSAYFRFKKIHKKLQEIHLEDSFEICFFDAFAPEVQPEMWTETIFRKIFDSLENGGLLLTYCAKGAVKRALKNAGFELENLPGPANKREITRARKKEA